MNKLLLIIVTLCVGISGCNSLPAEKIPEIPAELTPIYNCSHEIKHIAGHKILVFNYWNGSGGQFFALDLGKIEEVKLCQ